MGRVSVLFYATETLAVLIMMYTYCWDLDAGVFTKAPVLQAFTTPTTSSGLCIQSPASLLTSLTTTLT